MTVRAAAKQLGVHYVTLYRWINANGVVYITFGGTIFIPFLEVERLKKERAKAKEQTAGEYKNNKSKLS